MMGLLANMVFLQPWILSALLVLPLLWYLLRVTPPVPRMIYFPATRFLAGLISEEQTPNKTPWWILLLRLLIAALIIIALARPVYNPAENIEGSGPVRLVIDNSWAGAQTWALQISAAEEAIKQASRVQRELYILTTAPLPGAKAPLYKGPMAYQEAVSVLRGLGTQPWPADYKAAQALILENKPAQSLHTLWLGSGLDEGDLRLLIQSLQAQGSLTYTGPEPFRLPLLLRPAREKDTKSLEEQIALVKVSLDAAPAIPDLMPVSVQALSRSNQILDVQTVELKRSQLPQNVLFDIPEPLRNETGSFRISGMKGAGSLFLLDDQFQKRHVGIAEPAEDTDTAPLMNAGFYLKRALEPSATLTTDTLDALLKIENLSTIILPDVGAMPSDTLNALEEWVKAGGLLLRFSGPNLSESQGEQYLLPVRLRAGGRALEGSLSWEKPQAISAFEPSSPFYGLAISPDIKVKRQVLADPAQELDGKVWARLEDGTPLITGTPLERGLVVLIHTTATPDWSDLALSGLYVDILNRLIKMAGHSVKFLNMNQSYLEPIQVLDGNGNLMPPPGYVQSIPADKFAGFIPDSTHPPGIYGTGGFQVAINLGSALPPLKSVGTLPSSVVQKYYDADYEIDLMPRLLYAALILFLLDWVIMIVILSGGLFPVFGQRRKRGFGFSAFLFLFLLILASSAQAQDSTADKDMAYANGFYLAYVQSGDSGLDAVTQRGLESLSEILTRRTSVEPDGVVAVNPETDNLAFFPILYWAVSPGKAPYSGKAMQNVQNYLDHGGTIVFDTRDQSGSTGSTAETESARTLRQMTGSLNIPPLIPVPKDHVLTRSFYLLKDFPGRYNGGTVWVEQHSAGGRDDVSSVIIGGNDWAGSWASSGVGSSARQSMLFGGSKQEEMSLRFGVNLVMYALTGNYKNDQVHVPHILKRLDQ